MSTCMYRREDVQAFLAVWSTFTTNQRGEDLEWRLDFGLAGFSQYIRFYPTPFNEYITKTLSCTRPDTEASQSLFWRHKTMFFRLKANQLDGRTLRKEVFVTGCTISPILFVMDWISSSKLLGTKGSQRDKSSRKQGLREWPYHLYWESHPITMDSTGTRRYCLLGTYGIQAQHVLSQVKDPSTHTRRDHPITERSTNRSQQRQPMS